LELREYLLKNKRYTGRRISLEVSNILHGPMFGLEQGWVIMSVKRAAPPVSINEAKIQSVAFAAAHNVCESGATNALRHNVAAIAQAIRDYLA
jgi:hypothetical protein